MSEPLLIVDNLTIAFRTRRGTALAIDNVSLEIRPGEVLAVVGESGAGKSVTGTTIIGLLEPSAEIISGRINLAGRDIHALPPRDMERIRGRDVGAIFQDPMSSLDPLMSIGNQLIETIRTHRDLTREEARREAVSLLTEVGITSPEQRLRQYPHEFSGGMRQRVVIALALCGSPKLLIADEPTTALDAWTQVQIIELLQRLCRERDMAVMLITHDMSVVAAIADRVAVIYAGRIAECGPTRDIIEAPQHPYTRGLMLAIPRLGEARDRLAQIDGTMLPPSARGDFCAFHPRCPSATAVCKSAAPPSVTRGARQVGCWLKQEADAHAA
jgi:peptide/nickel transport system ATP-binding protein